MVEVREAPDYEFCLYRQVGRVDRLQRANVRHQLVVARHERLGEADSFRPEPRLLALGEPQMQAEVACQGVVGRVFVRADLKTQGPDGTFEPRRPGIPAKSEDELRRPNGVGLFQFEPGGHLPPALIVNPCRVVMEGPPHDL